MFCEGTVYLGKFTFMAVKKIDLNNFTKPELYARLFVIQRNWSKQSTSVTLNKEKALKYVEGVVKQNFKYPSGKLESVTYNLTLFLLGNNKNLFTKVLEG